MTEPTERDHEMARAIISDNGRRHSARLLDDEQIAKIIAAARADGWQAASHAWQNWLDTNIPDWDAMAGIDLTTLPKDPE